MSDAAITKSFFATNALARRLEQEYGLADVRCQLMTATVRDVYLVRTPQQQFIFFVYRANHPTLAHIAAEWQFVAYLAAHGVPVAPAVATPAGGTILTFAAPEGLRYGVLTAFVAGKHLRQRPSVAAVQTYGHHIATIHTLADAFPVPLDRPANDAALLIDQPLTASENALLDRPDAIRDLQAGVRLLRPRLLSLAKESPAYGLIHGDAIRANAQVADDGTVTVLDFDFCGLGWRAYDIASYLLTVRGTPDETAFADAFLQGYTSVRPLSDDEYHMLPLFEAVRAIVEIGVPAMYVDTWGSAYVYSFLDRSLAHFKRSLGQLT
jgi:Ser/Thr protein kinase RdoA (MazF antagonist)